jgi:hypothetical protein
MTLSPLQGLACSTFQAEKGVQKLPEIGGVFCEGRLAG